MNEPLVVNISSAASQMVGRKNGFGNEGRRYLRHPHGVGVRSAIMTVCTEDWGSGARVNSSTP